MVTWVLPAYGCERDLRGFLADAARFDSVDDEITLDFRNVCFWTPAPIAYLCAITCRWCRESRRVYCSNFEQCNAFSYLQRMDFFERIGLKVPETFRRHPAGSNFVEVAEIPWASTRMNDPLASRLASCLAGGVDDARQMAEFTLGEIIANVQQHSGSSGFCCAQYISKNDWARIGVADAGMGILESFRANKAPAFLANPAMNHTDALVAALRPWVSSRKHLTTGAYGEQSNRGVGLNMVQHMISAATGDLVVASGDAMVRFFGERAPEWSILPYAFPGTLVSILFPRGGVPGYHKLVSGAQAAINLMPDGDDDRYFI